MDAQNPEQARIAEAAAAGSRYGLWTIPADIRAAGGVSRMSDPKMIKEIQEAPYSVMRQGQSGILFVILEAIEID